MELEPTKIKQQINRNRDHIIKKSIPKKMDLHITAIMNLSGIFMVNIYSSHGSNVFRTRVGTRLELARKPC
jgi:hypothetical protein